MVSCGLHVSPESTFVLRTSPRLLVVTLAWKGLPACFAVLHGPDVAHGPEAASGWWAQTAATLRQDRPPGCSLLLLADADAKLGSVTSPLVSEHQEDQQSPTGELLHELSAEQDLAIPATFASRGEG